MSASHLEYLFEPRSVALVGASDRPGSAGYVALQNLRAGGWNGRLDLVNPRHAEVGGLPAVAAIADLPAVPDLAILCAPDHAVADSLRQLARRGARSAVVPGLLPPAARHAVFKAARAGLLRIVGPSAGGVLCPALGLHAGMLRQRPRAGSMALVCASTSFAAAVLDWAEERALGFSHCIALGDAADVDAADVLDYLTPQSHIRAVLLQLDRLPRARKFMSAARACARSKPVLVLKAPAPRGRDAGEAVFDAACRRAGLYRAHALDELLELAEMYARLGDVLPERIAICGNAPGPARLAQQELERAGCILPVPGEAVRARLVADLPSWRDAANPLDLAHEAPPETYAHALSALADDGRAELLVSMHAPLGDVPAAAVAQAVAGVAASLPLPLVTCWMGGAAAAEARLLCRGAGLIACADAAAPARALARAHASRAVRELLLEIPGQLVAPSIDWAARQHAIDQALALGQRRLAPEAALAWLAACGLPVVRQSEPAVNFPATGVLYFRHDPWLGPYLSVERAGRPAVCALLPQNEVFGIDFAAAADLPLAARPAAALVLTRLSDIVCRLRGLASIRLDLASMPGGRCQALRAEVRLDGRLAAPDTLLAIRPYPVNLERRLAWFGKELVLRPIRAEDAALHRTFFSHLDEEDVRLRFFAPVRGPHPALLVRLTQIDYDREMAFVAV
ncbi:MAG: CoA-binding protein, partial [Rhodocyclaceae bacterium]|nr:CoA-binding protein [Rhodocyclaceae bacterium]